MNIFCHLVTYLSFIASITSFILLLIRFPKKCQEKLSSLPKEPPRLNVSLGENNLYEEEVYKLKEKKIDIFMSFFDKEVINALIIVIIGFVPCFFDGYPISAVPEHMWSFPIYIGFGVLLALSIVFTVYNSYYRKKFGVTNIIFHNRNRKHNYHHWHAERETQSSRKIFAAIAVLLRGFHAGLSVYVFLFDFII